ncbi:MAG: DUF1592 domain-containing protein [Limisphaerales bacterium]
MPIESRLFHRTRVLAPFALGCLLGLAAAMATAAPAKPPQRAEFESFEGVIRPLLARYCLDCHSTAKLEGDLDLEQFTSLAEIESRPRIWEGVLEQLGHGEMPPKKAPQPSADERSLLESWTRAALDRIALARAGDPGPVILRRLSNAEYTYSVRDLTGVDSLDPAREFPIDGAAGEGFMNTGGALVMSSTLLTKYLDAAQEVALHAVLLPDGLRFSPSTSRRDWTEEVLAEIRELYRRHTDPRGGTEVHLQGLVWETNQGGRLPLERYFAALASLRKSGDSPRATPESAARDSGISPKYLAILRSALRDGSRSLLMDRLRALAHGPTPASPAALAAWIGPWQQALWKFGSVGHIGKVGGPKAWMEPVTPLAFRQDFRVALTNVPDRAFVTLRLHASDAGDGGTDDTVVWERPRLVTPGRPDILLRDLRAVSEDLGRSRARMIATVPDCLAAAAEAADLSPADGLTVADLARRHDVEEPTLRAWLEMLGISTGGPASITGHFTDRIESTAGYEFVRGWGKAETPLLVANSSDSHVRIPGNLHGHGVAVHPSPTLNAVVSWRSPVAASFRIEASITHAHPECGNGVTWSVESRRGAYRQRLASGVAQGGRVVRTDPAEVQGFQAGDVISLVVGPRAGNHACDLTAVDLIITEVPSAPGATERIWNLAQDISPDVLAGNPHADRHGNPEVWHFHAEPAAADGSPAPVLPPGSLLAKWRITTDPTERAALAKSFQSLLEAGAPPDPAHPDAVLRRLVFAPNGPLLRGLLARRNPDPAPSTQGSSPETLGAGIGRPGVEPSLFGRTPNGDAIPAADLSFHAPATLEFRIPTELAEGSEFVVTAGLHPSAGPEGSVQFRVEAMTVAEETPAAHPVPDPRSPFIVAEGGAARHRLEAAFDEFRRVFPAALCYTKIVPVDEVVTLTLFYREDDALRRLVLDDHEAARLDRLWDELHYVSHDALTLVDAFAQLMEYATQDADPSVFEPLRGPIHARAARFKETLLETQPRHLEAVLAFAEMAYRRPLQKGESESLRALYTRLRDQELSHDNAIRFALARVLVSPAFLYRVEEPPAGAESGPISSWELASRLSYFLWSSVPDAPLRAAAASGELTDPGTLGRHLRRMLADPRIRRLATEFGCQWVHVHGFDALEEKSERHFPTFTPMREALYEEAIQFFTDFFQRDLPVASLLDADHTFLNDALAGHYGIPGVTGPEWRRVDGIRAHGRGGLLGLGAILAKQSGASRTSPILRGNWISEVLLGEKLPRPPKDVPQLPEDERTAGMTVRQMVERHSSDPRCSGCHVRIDPYGFALEAYDAIGRYRTRDLSDRPLEVVAKSADGRTFEGLDGLRNYLLGTRPDAFLDQFCRKLLGYALGRSVQLSDTPLLRDVRANLDAGGGRVSQAIETIVLSRQFREIRGREADNQP